MHNIKNRLLSLMLALSMILAVGLPLASTWELLIQYPPRYTHLHRSKRSVAYRDTHKPEHFTHRGRVVAFGLHLYDWGDDTH